MVLYANISWGLAKHFVLSGGWNELIFISLTENHKRGEGVDVKPIDQSMDLINYLSSGILIVAISDLKAW